MTTDPLATGAESAATPAFVRFLESLDAPASTPSQALAFDEVAWAALGPEERARAAASVVARLRSGEDNPRLVEVAATLGTSEALDALSDLLTVPVERATATTLNAAHRRWVLSGDRGAAAVLAGIAGRCPAQSLRQAALAALSGVPDELARPALLEALGDDARAVRSAAWEQLLLRFGLTPYKWAGGPLAFLSFGLIAAFPTVRAEARLASLALLRDLAAGAAPEALGLVAGKPTLSPALLAFRDSLGLFRPGPPDGSRYALELLDALAPEERPYAADLLIGRLELGVPEAAAGLSRLATPRARVALRDAADLTPPGPLRDAVLSALASDGA